jgi:hypothetical protein
MMISSSGVNGPKLEMRGKLTARGTRASAFALHDNGIDWYWKGVEVCVCYIDLS